MLTDPYTGLPAFLSDKTDLVGLWPNNHKPAPFYNNCLKIIPIDPRWWALPCSLFSSLRAVRNGLGPDVVICGVDEYSMAIALWIGRITSTPIFCVVEDPPFTGRYLNRGGTRRPERLFRQRVLRHFLHRTAGIFCFIEKDILDDFDLSGVSIYQMMNGASAAALQWFRDRPAQEAASSPFTIGYVGAINERQGSEDLLTIYSQAKQRVPNLRLRLIGPLENDFARKFREKISTFETGSIELIDWLPYEKMLEKLNECHIGVYCNPPSDWSIAAQPLKVCEYLALGKVPIAWDYPGTRRLLDHGHYGILVPPGRIDTFAHAIVALTDPVVRNSIESEIRLGVQGQLSSQYWYHEVLTKMREFRESRHLS